jgi:hypothetical protein
MQQSDQMTAVNDGDWAIIHLRDELTDRATFVANKLGMHFEQFMMLALDEKLTRMGLRNGPGRPDTMPNNQKAPDLTSAN